MRQFCWTTLAVLGCILAWLSPQAFAQGGVTQSRETAPISTPMPPVSPNAGSSSPESRPIATYQKPESAVLITRDGSKDPGLGSLVSLASNLVVVVVLIVVCGAVWRRYSTGAAWRPAGDGTSPRVLTTLNLAPQRFLHVVQIGSRRYILGSTPQQIALLGTVDDPDPAQFHDYTSGEHYSRGGERESGRRGGMRSRSIDGGVELPVDSEFDRLVEQFKRAETEPIGEDARTSQSFFSKGARRTAGGGQ